MVGFVGAEVPDEAQHPLRDRSRRALGRGRPRRRSHEEEAARARLRGRRRRPRIADKAGFGNRALRPTGHALDTRRFGDETTFDDATDADDRQLLQRTGYVVEPGLYVAGAFGVRVAVDLFLAADGPHFTPNPPQQEIELIR